MKYSIQNLSVFFPANSFYAVKDISFELKGKTVFALSTGIGRTKSVGRFLKAANRPQNNDQHPLFHDKIRLITTLYSLFIKTIKRRK